MSDKILLDILVIVCIVSVITIAILYVKIAELKSMNEPHNNPAIMGKYSDRPHLCKYWDIVLTDNGDIVPMPNPLYKGY